MRRIIYILLLSFCSIIALADSERMPIPQIFSSPNNTYYLKLVPDRQFDEKKAKGYVYKVGHEKDNLQYEIFGWHSFSVLLSPDGENIVRLGPWPRAGTPPDKALAIAFYNNGKLIKKYTVSDLIENPRDLPQSISHYSWGGRLKWSGNWWENTVQVTTEENKVIKFNIKTGAIH